MILGGGNERLWPRAFWDAPEVLMRHIVSVADRRADYVFWDKPGVDSPHADFVMLARLGQALSRARPVPLAAPTPP